MKRIYGLVIAMAMGFGLSAQGQDKATECLAIANVFQEAGQGYQLSGNMTDALNLTDRVLAGVKNLNLQDPKLKNLQSRYITYLTSSSQLLKQGQQNQNNETALNALLTSARANSAMGHSLGQELAEYCLQ